MNAIVMILRALEFFWTLFIMALIGDVISDHGGDSNSIVNYDMFTVVFTMLCLFYLIAVAFKEDLNLHPILPLVLDIIITFFFFVGGVATGAKLGVHSCSNQGYLATNSVIRGSSDPGKSCREAQASTAFFWFGFLCFAASSFFSFTGARGSGANLRSGGIRKGGPSMTQV